MQLADLKLIVLSDQHKGTRDGADDFQRCERAYNAALAHYLEHGHRLFALGDVEELWECDPEEVIASYARTLELEAEFHRSGRYERFWGNHDDLWREPGQVAKHLQGRFEGLAVRETLRVRVMRGAELLGELFFAHGHQGTLDADRFGWISRLFVRHVWRPLQRKLGMASTAPSVDWRLRGDHDTAMYEWARDHPARVVLVAGHTHRPVFGASAPSPELEESAADLEGRLAKLRDRRCGLRRDRGARARDSSGGGRRSSGSSSRRPRRSSARATSTPAAARTATATSPGSSWRATSFAWSDGSEAEGEIAPRHLATDTLTGVFRSVGSGGGATA